MHLSISEARELSEGVLARHGYSENDARLITDVIVEAHLWGRPLSGMRHLLQIVERAKDKDRGTIRVVSEDDHSALIDAENNPGFLASNYAIRLAMAKARKSGVAVVGVRRSFLGGINGYYVSLAAREDLIALMSVSGGSRVAPWGGIDPVFGTNPLAVAVPTLNDPVIFDMTTAATNVGHLQTAARLGEPLPAGLAIDNNGEPTTDPARALQGAILPFGEHKGFGLAFVIQCLGILVGGDIAPQGMKDFGYFFLVIDPGMFMRVQDYKARVTELVRRVRQSRTRAGEASVRVPGERSLRERARRQVEGIDLDDRTYAELLRLR